jgi:hypothetical protein
VGLGAGEKRSSSKGGVKTDGSGSENGVGVRSKEGRHTDKVMRERGIGKRIYRYRRTRGEVEIPSGGGSKDGAIRDFKKCGWEGRVRCVQVKNRLEEAGTYKYGGTARITDSRVSRKIGR